MNVAVFFLALLGLVAWWFVDPWMQAQGLGREIGGEWVLVAQGWAVLWRAWPLALVVVLLSAALWVPLGALLARGGEKAQARVRSWQEQQELEEGRQAIAALSQALADVEALRRRLKALEGLGDREKVISAAEAVLEAQKGNIERQARETLEQARREAQAIRAQAEAEFAKVGAWKRAIQANESTVRAVRERLEYARKHARRVRDEFEFAKREGREPHLPLIRKEARRLVRALTGPQESDSDEQARVTAQGG